MTRTAVAAPAPDDRDRILAEIAYLLGAVRPRTRLTLRVNTTVTVHHFDREVLRQRHTHLFRDSA